MVVPDPTFAAATPSDTVLAGGGWKKFPDFSSRAMLRKALQFASPEAPKVMAVPPTGAVAGPNPPPTTGLTQNIPHTDSRIGYRCATWNALGGSRFSMNCAGADWDIAHCAEIEFHWYGRKIDFVVAVTSTVGRIRVKCDGEYVAAGAAPLTAGNGSLYNIAYDFATTALRHITIELYQAGFNSLNLEPTGIIFPPQQRAIKALFLGDSYTQFANAAEVLHNGWALECARRMGWDEYWLCGEGGTGYLNNAASSGAPGRKTFRNRLVSDVYAVNPDVIVIWGGINDADGTHTKAAIQAEAEAVYTDIRKNAPLGRAGYAPRLYVVGCQQPAANPIQLVIDCNDALRTACANQNVPFIDPTGWVTAGTTWVTSGDLVHPTDDGHKYLGRRIATAIQALDLAPIG